jgi:V8-like Glu-specific endopeptidase
LTLLSRHFYKRRSSLKGVTVQSKIFVAALVGISLVGCGPEIAAGPEVDGEGTLSQPTICGSRDDSQFVNDYTGTLGPTVAFVNTNKRAVGAMENTNTATSSKFCSGTLISSDLFLTAGHCVDGTTVGKFVAFNYERARGSTTLLSQSHFRIAQVIEDGLSGVDYAILRLEGSPGNTFGVAPLRTGTLRVGEAITIIGHPQGKPKMVEGGTIQSITGSRVAYGNLDTLGGNSGSGILDADGNVVIVHTNGGCTRTGGANTGWSLASVAAASSVF